jgi:serine/threonine protein kinase
VKHEPEAPTPVHPPLEPEQATFAHSDTAPTRAAPVLNDPGLRPGDHLGQFVLVRTIGSGGMGWVWAATDPTLGRSVAIKTMRSELASDVTIRERFLREAKAQAAVRHPQVAEVYTVGEQAGVPYFVMPLLVGETLSTRLKRAGVLPLPDVLRIGRQVAEGLGAAHQKGLIHRDVKPGNVWLNAPSGDVLLLDFGIVRMPDPGPLGDPITNTGMVIGTPAYMAPEQAAGKRVDARADLFSLGVLLYEMSTGVHPFRHESLYTTLTALANTDPPMPNVVRPQVPAVVADLIDRLLAKDPADRWPTTAGEVAGYLGRMETPEGATVTLPRRRRKDPNRNWRRFAPVLLALLFAPVGCFAWRGVFLAPTPVTTAPPTPAEFLRQFADRLREQPIENTSVDVNRNGLLGNERKNTHRFKGTTGVPVLSEVRDGRAAVRIPYDGVYDRTSVELGFYTTPETKSVRGVVLATLQANGGGVRVTGFEHAETDGEVTDRSHNAQKGARAAVETLVNRTAR